VPVDLVQRNVITSRGLSCFEERVDFEKYDTWLRTRSVRDAKRRCTDQGMMQAKAQGWPSDKRIRLLY